jgi:hypothetical protein
MILTGPFLIAFLIDAVYRIGRKPKTPPEPKPSKVSVIVINSLTGELEPRTITADWNEYARVIDADTITIGARGPGYVVMINERLNSFTNTTATGGVPYPGKAPQSIQGHGAGGTHGGGAGGDSGRDLPAGERDHGDPRDRDMKNQNMKALQVDRYGNKKKCSWVTNRLTTLT